MSRLIDADKLIEELKESYDDDLQKELEYLGIYEFIKEQPTTFDVDKVVEQLEWCSKKYEKLAKGTSVEFPQECFRKGISYGYRDSIDRVKAGGRDDIRT